MKFFTKTYLTCTLLVLTGGHGFSQFIGEIDNSYGSGGKLWYNYDGSTSPITSEKMVLDETGEHLYFSGYINDGSSDNSMIVKSNLEGVLIDAYDIDEGTLLYNYLADVFDNRFHSMAAQSNGKMVGVGKIDLEAGNSDIIISRFNTDGTLDPTFNDGGELIMDVNGGYDFASDVILQADGKIIVVGAQETGMGTGEYDVFIARLNSDGSFDGTFGDGGLNIIDAAIGYAIIHSVALLSDGGIMMVGHIANEGGVRGLAIKLDEDGNFDTEFSDDGINIFQINELPTSTNKIIEVDGGVLIAGNTDLDGEGENGINGFIVKLNNSGEIDITFSEAGIYYTEFEVGISADTTFAIRDFEIMPSGQILISGDYMTGATSATGLILLHADGSIDVEFGLEGLRKYYLDGGAGDNLHESSQIEVSSSNKVFLSAQVTAGAYQNIISVRLFGDHAGINDLGENKLVFTIYPNPSNAELNISYNNESEQSIAIRIIDLSGRVLMSKIVSGLQLGDNTISLSDEVSTLLSGTYFINIQAGENQVNQTFIKL